DSIRRRSKSVPITPRDENRLLRLRQDPSVASLLNVYDEHGCLDSKVFSNTPPSPAHEGRAQTRRRRSTLRQLLGRPGCQVLGAAEGDISWAEKFLECVQDYAFARRITHVLSLAKQRIPPPSRRLKGSKHQKTFFSITIILTTSTTLRSLPPAIPLKT
ncbi:hypothetical protein SERLA73DRAFT_184895, partial [Serpula lacrymans var. lacrymans S7.3]